VRNPADPIELGRDDPRRLGLHMSSVLVRPAEAAGGG